MPSTISTVLLRLAAVLGLGCVPFASGCEESADAPAQDGGDGDLDAAHDEELPVGPASGATCPDDAGALTYEDFGKPFVETYCTRCHSSDLEGADRNEAPLDHDFDSLAGILLVAEHVDQLAASGPDATNTFMPPNGAKPTLEERELLGQWLACEQGN